MKQPFSRRGILVLLGVVALLVIALPLAGVLAQSGGPLSGPTELCPKCPVSFRTPSILAPASIEAAQTLGLFNFIMVIATVIFVLVEGLLIFAIFRYRNRRPEQALQIHGNTKLEIAWTAMPAIILAVLLGFTLRTMKDIKALPTGKVVNVIAIGHQWWWEFQYPDLTITTANELVVPLGSAIEVSVQSVDVEHGFWTPELFGKVDAVPGYTTRLKFTPTHTGTYGGQCTQFCGVQHAQMRFSVRVVNESEFQAWAANEQQPAVAATGEALEGQEIFLNPDFRCIACHAVNGTTAVGTTGPNLTHMANRQFIAGGILANTPENLLPWIHNAPALKPGTLMPALGRTDQLAAGLPADKGLTDEQIEKIVAYLTTLK